LTFTANGTAEKVICGMSLSNGQQLKRGLTVEDITNTIEMRLDGIIQKRLTRALHHRRFMEEAFVFKGRNASHDNRTVPLFVTLNAPAGGGLGNFMFWTAALIGVARKNNRVMSSFDVFPCDRAVKTVFRIINKILIRIKIFRQATSFFFPNNIIFTIIESCNYFF